MSYDVLLKNGFVVDYATDITRIADVAIKDGKIVRVDQDIDASAAQELYDLEGLTVVPGIIDPHVHLSAWLGGGLGHKMLAKAGVTTALDMSGPGESVFELIQSHGVGINVATIEYVRPGHTVSSADPGEQEIAELLSRLAKQGSIGVKMLAACRTFPPKMRK